MVRSTGVSREPAAHGERADRVWLRMRALVHEHEVARARASTALGMSGTRIEAVRLRAAEPEPLTMGRLATRLHTDRPYAGVVVDDLEKHGLVARLPHPTDRRVRMVAVTAGGLDRALGHLERAPRLPRSA